MLFIFNMHLLKIQFFGPAVLPLVSTSPFFPSLERCLHVECLSISQKLQFESRLHFSKHFSGVSVSSTLPFIIFPLGYDVSILHAINKGENSNMEKQNANTMIMRI